MTLFLWKVCPKCDRLYRTAGNAVRYCYIASGRSTAGRIVWCVRPEESGQIDRVSGGFSMNKNFSKKIAAVLSCALVFSALAVMPAMAESNEALGPGYIGNQEVAAHRAGETGAAAGSTAVISGSTGPVTADPVLGLVPDVHVQMKTGDGNFTDGFTTNMDMFNSPLDGFCGLYCRLENGVGDVFYRVYTEEHGWTRWAMNEMNTDWFNDAAKVTAVQMRIKGYTRNLYSLYYRVELNDGTLLDWARDGQTAGTIGTGKYIQKMQVRLWKNGKSFAESTLRHFTGADVEGIVNAVDGTVTYSTAKGVPYTGWAYDTDNNKYYFEENHAVTGWKYIDGIKFYFDEKGKLVTDLEPVLGLTGNYVIKVNKDMKCMTIYTADETGNYVVPYKVFLCTIGSSTPVGEFKLFEPHRWKFMHDDIYVQYLIRYKNPGFCIHSIIYRPTEGSYNLIASTYNQLGKNYSDGCIRLLSGDAAWLYSNCGANTMMTIYNDEWVMGPFDRPAIEMAIPETQRWDPTDPVVIADMTNKTGPFASGTYDGTGYETPLPQTAEEKAAQAALVEE